MNRVFARINKESFVFLEKIRSRMFSKQRLKILFSKKEDDWEHFLSIGFRFTRHEIAFKEFYPENVKSYDLVVPLTINDLKRLDRMRDLISDNPIPITNLKSIELCDEKYRFNQALIENGYDDFIPKMDKPQSYPYILKKKIDEWGKNTHIISDIEQEQFFSDILDHPDYFCQQLIPGASEYATHILFKDDKVVCSMNIKYLFKTEHPIKGKDIPIYENICQCSYLEEFSSILKLVGFEGLCCVNYKVIDNRPLIIEINPRFGGSLCRFFFSFMRHLD